MAGVRPSACRAKKATTAGVTLGSMTPTASPGDVCGRSAWPSTRAPMISRPQASGWRFTSSTTRALAP